MKHGIYKNLSGDTIYNSQVATLVFLVGIAFKISAAPAMINQEFGSSTFWAYLGYSAVDVVATLIVFVFARSNGDAFLTSTNSVLYRALAFVASLYMTIKGVFHFSYASSYLTHELFVGLEPSLIYLLFLLPVVYLGAKGISTLARTSEIFFPAIFLMLALNLVFLKTKADFARVLPVFSREPSELLGLFPRYGLWLGDMLPFVFVRIKDKKLPYATIGVVGTWLFVNLVLLLGVAIYGDALKTVSDLLIRIAGFNSLSKDIVRTEWSNLIAALTTSIVSLAFSYFGALSAMRRAIKTDLPIKIAYPLAILLTVLIVPSAQSVTKFATESFGYVLFALAIVLPLLFICALALAKRKYPSIQKLLDDEYVKFKQQTPDIDSNAVGLLDGFKRENSDGQTV